MAEEASFVKGGEERARISVRRSKGGVIFNVQLHPDLEEFIRNWGDGESQDVKEFVGGREWESKTPLKVWNITTDPGNVNFGEGYYSLNQPGRGPIWQEGRDIGLSGGLVNLATLRLVGASEHNGVSFEVKGAFSWPYLRKILAKWSEASKRFYIDYVLPIDISVKIITQETRL